MVTAVRRGRRTVTLHYRHGMARSRAVVVATVAATVLGSIASGWWLGGAAPAVVSATVVHVVDGDTLVAAFRDGHTETVRVLGIDTPETVDPRKPVQCFGPRGIGVRQGPPERTLGAARVRCRTARSLRATARVRARRRSNATKTICSDAVSLGSS